MTSEKAQKTRRWEDVIKNKNAELLADEVSNCKKIKQFMVKYNIYMIGCKTGDGPEVTGRRNYIIIYGILRVANFIVIVMAAIERFNAVFSQSHGVRLRIRTSAYV